MKLSKTAQKWNDLIDKKVKYENAPWSENEIIYFRKALGQSGLKSDYERAYLLEKFELDMPEDGYNITQDQQRKGFKYLLKNTYKKNGDLRKNNIFNYVELEILNCYSHFYSHFKFVGLHPQTSILGETLGYLPIYRLYDIRGNYFDYTGTVYSLIKIINTSYTPEYKPLSEV